MPDTMTMPRPTTMVDALPSRPRPLAEELAAATAIEGTDLRIPGYVHKALEVTATRTHAPTATSEVAAAAAKAAAESPDKPSAYFLAWEAKAKESYDPQSWGVGDEPWGQELRDMYKIADAPVAPEVPEPVVMSPIFEHARQKRSLRAVLKNHVEHASDWWAEKGLRQTVIGVGMAACALMIANVGLALQDGPSAEVQFAAPKAPATTTVPEGLTTPTIPALLPEALPAGNAQDQAKKDQEAQAPPQANRQPGARIDTNLPKALAPPDTAPLPKRNPAPAAAQAATPKPADKPPITAPPTTAPRPPVAPPTTEAPTPTRPPATTVPPTTPTTIEQHPAPTTTTPELPAEEEDETDESGLPSIPANVTD